MCPANLLNFYPGRCSQKEHRGKDLEKLREVEEISWKYHGNIVDFEQHDLDRLSELECCKALMYSDMDISAVRERVEEQTQTGNNTRVPADL